MTALKKYSWQGWITKQLFNGKHLFFYHIKHQFQWENTTSTPEEKAAKDPGKGWIRYV